MPTTISSTSDPVEEKLRTFVEGLLGGKVTAMQRCCAGVRPGTLNCNAMAKSFSCIFVASAEVMSAHSLSCEGKRIF
jgi:hypothetical protein